jgi:hypothetical protein
MMFIGLFWLVVILLVVRWMVPPDAGRALPETRRVEGELERLREEVDRLSGQVQRLLDEQSFLLRLLERGEDPAEPPSLEGARRESLPPADAPDQKPTQ